MDDVSKHGQFAITPARSLDDTRFDDKDKHLRSLQVLGTYADKNGWCYPSLATVGDRLLISRSAVSAIFHDLANWGYILIIPTKTDDGGYTSNRYRILFDTELPIQFDRTNPEHPVQKTRTARKHPVQTPSVEIVPNAPSNAPIERGGEKTSPLPAEKQPAEEPYRHTETVHVFKDPVQTDARASVALDNDPARQTQSADFARAVYKETYGRDADAEFAAMPSVKDAPVSTKGNRDASLAVLTFLQVRGKMPPKETYQMIAEQVGSEEVALDYWRKVLVEYAALGWNRQSVSGPLEWFARHEMPHVNGKTWEQGGDKTQRGAIEVTL